jgi:hypothetical protein
MTKILDFKKPTAWESAQDMAESFAERLGNDEDEVATNMHSAVIMYRLKDGTVTFECSGSANVLDVGMMASAVHLACLYELMGEEDAVIH